MPLALIIYDFRRTMSVPIQGFIKSTRMTRLFEVMAKSVNLLTKEAQHALCLL